MNVTLTSFFEWLLTASFMGSVLVLFIFAAKFVLRDKLSPRWTYVLWMLLIVRLILPWTPETSFSVYNLIPIERFSTTEVNHPQLDHSETPVTSKTNPPTTEQSNTPLLQEPTVLTEVDKPKAVHNPSNLVQSTSLKFTLLQFLSLLWLAGFVLVVAILLVVNLRFRNRMKHEPSITVKRIQQLFMTSKQMMGIKRRILLIRSNKVPIATLSGVMSPKLLLPDTILNSLTDDELKHLFLHELSHMKRGDIAINGLMNLLLAMHWFNPLLWYAYHKMREDQELACDAMALVHLPSEQSQAYAFTLIKLLEMVPSRSSLANTASISSGKKEMYRRINMIKAFKKQTYKSALLGIIVMLILSSCALTSPKAVAPEPIDADHLQLEANQANTEEIEQLAKVWADALKTRDGEPRYEMMSERARQKFEQEQINTSGEDWNYIIGNSSPWVIDYNIQIEGTIATITYTTQTSEPANYNAQETVIFKQEGLTFVVDDYTTEFEDSAIDVNIENDGTANTSLEKISIFNSNPIAAYNSADVVTIELNNEVLETEFHKVRFEPFGFYMPSNMELYSFEDGDEWGYDLGRHHVNFNWYDNDIVEAADIINEQLTKYSEYVGSVINDGTMIDYFVFQHGDRSFIISFLYWEVEQDTALPLFLKFVETMRYVEE